MLLYLILSSFYTCLKPCFRGWKDGEKTVQGRQIYEADLSRCKASVHRAAAAARVYGGRGETRTAAVRRLYHGRRTTDSAAQTSGHSFATELQEQCCNFADR